MNNKTRFSPLEFAISLGNWRVVDLLEKEDKTSTFLHVHQPEKRIFAKLTQTIIQGDTTLVNKLLDNNSALTYAAPNGVTALHIAVMHNRNEIVDQLIANGADVNFPSAEDNWTALHYAAESGDSGIINALLTANA